MGLQKDLFPGRINDVYLSREEVEELGELYARAFASIMLVFGDLETVMSGKDIPREVRNVVQHMWKIIKRVDDQARAIRLQDRSSRWQRGQGGR